MSELSRPAPLGGRGPMTRVVLWVGPVLVSTVVPFWVDIHSQRAMTECLHQLVQLRAQPGHLTLADACHAQGLHQLIHFAGAHAVDVSFLDHGDKGFFRSPTGLQQTWEVAALTQLRDAQIDGADPRVPLAMSISVSIRHSFCGALMPLCTDLSAHLKFHQLLRQQLNSLAQKVEIGAGLVKELSKRDA